MFFRTKCFEACVRRRALSEVAVPVHLGSTQEVERFLIQCCFSCSLNRLAMGKGVPLRVKQANAKMPFRAKEHGKTKPTTWKQKQKVCANAGLRAMSAPWAGSLRFQR